MSNITINNKYRYRINDRLGEYFAQTLGEGKVEISYSKTDNLKVDYTPSFDGKITFFGVDYQRFITLETSQYRCSLVNIVVQRKCSGSSLWVDWFPGTISLNDGTFNASKCTVEFKIGITDLYSPWESIKGDDVNIFTAALTRYTVKLQPSNVLIETADYTTTSSNLMSCFSNWNGTPGGGTDGGFQRKWVPYYQHCESQQTGPTTKILNIRTKWAREYVVLPCDQNPGPSWTLDTNNCASNNTQKWVRPATVLDCQYTYGDYTNDSYAYTMSCSVVGLTGSGTSGAATQIQNGCKMYDVLTYMLRKAYGNSAYIVSDFLQWNPDNVSTINPVTNANSKTRHLFIYQKSDVKRPNSGTAATIGNITPEKALNALCYVYNLGWHMETRNGVPVMRIENISQFQRKTGLDLTDPKYKKWLEGNYEWEYDNTKIPKSEEFLWMDTGFAGDFKGVPITYNNGCVTSEQKNQTKTIALDYITTDLSYIMANKDPDSKAVSDDGFVLVACDFDGTNYTVITEAGILDNAKLNNSLAWAQLHRDYYIYNRPLRQGYMNNQLTTFLSVQPIKKGKTITIPFCCEDFTGSNDGSSSPFSPFDKIVGLFGTATVDQAKINLKQDTISLDLLYAANENLEANKPPVANNDTAVMYNNGNPLSILPADNDTDPEGEPLTRLEIYNGPFSGTATVDGELRIVYTPNSGFTGTDFIYYRVYDKWDEPSNGALITITVRPPNAPPVAGNDAYQASKNTALTVNAANGLFKNDSDDVGFTLQSFQTPSANGGTVSVNADGSFTYTPATGYTGSDTFTYTIVDELSQTATGTVTISVVDQTIPRAVDDKYSTMRNNSLVQNGYPAATYNTPSIGANDYLPSGYTFKTKEFPNWSGVTAQGGNYNMGSQGQIIYNPPSNYIGTDSFPYSLVDASNNVLSTATVYVNVHAAVYARLQVIQGQYSYIYGSCNGNTNQILGTQTPYTVRIQFFTDGSLSVPLNVTDMDFQICYRRTRKQSSDGTNFFTNTTDTWVKATGTSMDVISNQIIDVYQQNCQGNTVNNDTSTFTLIATNNYVIA